LCLSIGDHYTTISVWLPFNPIPDTLAEKDFDDITELAAAICNTPVALITFIGNNRQWFKSNKGMPISETDTSLALCTHTITSPPQVMEVKHARPDVRTKR
jgi:two-component system, OmpR family, sensor histidine kinase VicK